MIKKGRGGEGRGGEGGGEWVRLRDLGIDCFFSWPFSRRRGKGVFAARTSHKFDTEQTFELARDVGTYLTGSFKDDISQAAKQIDISTFPVIQRSTLGSMLMNSRPVSWTDVAL